MTTPAPVSSRRRAISSTRGFASLWVRPGERLVEQHHLRLAGEHLRELEELRRAERKLGHLRVGDVLEPEEVEQLVGLGAAPPSGPRRHDHGLDLLDRLDRREHVVARGQTRGEADGLERPGQPGPRAPMRRPAT